MSDLSNILLSSEPVDDASLMQSIADGTYTDSIVTTLTEKDKTINQMKLFLLAQAKRELQRVLKLTEFLNKVEDAYENKVITNLDEIPLNDYPYIISTISSCLSRSSGIIQKVLNDDSLTNLVIIDNSINKNVAIGSSNVLGLTSPDSRDRVSKVVKNMINTIENYQIDTDNSEVAQDE